MRVLILTILLLTGCATSAPKTAQPIVLSESVKEAWVEKTEEWVSDLRRLDAVSSRILMKGIEYCKKLDHVAPYIGARFWSNQLFAEELHQAILAKLNLGEELQFLSIAPLSPAEIAGFKIGDKIVTVNGQSVSKSDDINKKIVESESNGNLISFDIRRDGEHKTISVSPVAACKSEIVLISEPGIYTVTNGETIQVSKGLVDFSESDVEIAVIVSHQLAQNALGFKKKNNIYGVLGGLAGGIAGITADVGLALLTGGTYVNGTFTAIGWEAGKLSAGSISAKQLKQADLDSLHLMVLAGYEIDQVSDFWLRIQEFNDGQHNNFLRNSHPFSRDRALAIEAVQKEYRGKKNNEEI